MMNLLFQHHCMPQFSQNVINSTFCKRNKVVFLIRWGKCSLKEHSENPKENIFEIEHLAGNILLKDLALRKNKYEIKGD